MYPVECKSRGAFGLNAWRNRRTHEQRFRGLIDTDVAFKTLSQSKKLVQI